MCEYVFLRQAMHTLSSGYSSKLSAEHDHQWLSALSHSAFAESLAMGFEKECYLFSNSTFSIKIVSCTV